MRCQAERERQYFDLKLDPATQLWNGVCGSKLSLHFSRSSNFSTFASYVIPTVYTRRSVNDITVWDLPCPFCIKINPFNDISSHTMIEIFGREILLIGVFSQKPTATGFQWISKKSDQAVHFCYPLQKLDIFWTKFSFLDHCACCAEPVPVPVRLDMVNCRRFRFFTSW